MTFLTEKLIIATLLEKEEKENKAEKTEIKEMFKYLYVKIVEPDYYSWICKADVH